MFERHIISIRTDAAGNEDVAATRERLKGNFPPGAVRRMTQLGMLISNVLGQLDPAADDTIVYATQYAEGRTLETYLESFPTASPIGFQTSIHPGAVQQGMIRRAQPVGDFFPMAGCDYLVGQALLSALIAPAKRVVLCGGEERGTWLVPIDGAGARAFAYGMILSRTVPDSTLASGSAPSLGRITLTPAADSAADASAPAPIAPAAWFDTLHARQNFSGIVSPGWHATLSWQ